MDISRRIFLNSVWLYTAQIISTGSLFVLTLVVARQLGIVEFGRFAFANSVIVILSVLAEAGIATYLVKEGSRRPEQRTMLAGQAIVVRCITTGIALGLGVVYLLIAVPDHNLRLLIGILSLSIITNIFSNTIIALFRTEERMHAEAMVSTATSLFITAAGIIVVTAGFGVVGLVVVSVLGALLAMITYFIVWKRLSTVKSVVLSQNRFHLFHFLQRALPFAVLAILGTIYFRIDTIMIEQMLGLHAVGAYSAAYRLMEGLLIIPWIFSGVILPAVAKAMDHQQQRVQTSSLQAIKFMLLVAVPLVAFVAIFARPIILLVYGVHYIASVPALQMLAFTFIAVFISAITSAVINASTRPVINTYLAFGMVIVNVILNLLLLPRYGIMGAAVATFVTEIAGMLVGTWYIYRALFPLSYGRYFFKPTIAIIPIVLLSFWSTSWWALLLFTVLYFVITVSIRALNQEDWRVVRALLQRSPEPMKSEL